MYRKVDPPFEQGPLQRADERPHRPIDPEAPVGKPFAEYQGLSGEVLELDVPPNRPDALCIYGIAREVAALYNLPLSPWQASVEENGVPASDVIAVDVEDEEGGEV